MVHISEILPSAKWKTFTVSIVIVLVPFLAHDLLKLDTVGVVGEHVVSCHVLYVAQRSDVLTHDRPELLFAVVRSR